MMKFFYRRYQITLLFAVVFLTACTEAPTEKQSEKQTGQQTSTITLLQINDLHAHLTPHLDRVAVTGTDGMRTTEVVERGGLARLATAIKAIHKETADTLLMNIGDTYHGGAEALFSYGNAIIDPVNLLGIDVGVPGNWDFAYGPGVTWRRYFAVSERLLPESSTGLPAEEVKKPNFPHLAANISFSLPPRQSGEPALPPTMLRKVGDVNVGIIGITSDIVPMMHEVLATGLSFLQGEDNYKTLIDTHTTKLREQGAEVVIVMSELGIQKDYRLAQIIKPGVDVFFSAHTHEVTEQPLTSASGALVVEAGNDGYLGRMDITLEQGDIVDTRWELISISADIAEDPEMAHAVSQARAPYVGDAVNVLLKSPAGTITLNRSIESVVGYTDEPLDRRQALESTFNIVFSELLKQSAGTQLGMTPGFRYDNVLLPYGASLEEKSYATGAVTLENVYRFFPVTYYLVTGETTGANLKMVMENNLTRVFSSSAFEQGGGWLDAFAGVSVVLDLSKADGQRITNLYHEGTELEIADTEQLTLAGCQRPFDDTDVVCSYPGFSNVQPLLNPATGVAHTPQTFFIQSLTNGNLSGSNNKKIHDINKTPQWPTATFVQPLKGVQ